MNFKMGEFFCGPGGIALGALLAGKVRSEDGTEFSISPYFATDYDLDTCRTYSRNIHSEKLEESKHVIHKDVREIDINSLPYADGFAFGFPCNDFSIVGESKGLDGKFGPLFSYGVNYLRAKKPLWFIAENVGGLTSSNEGKAFELIKSELIASGYRLVSNLYKFEKYGVPQSRHRIIIVGIREDLDVSFKVPAPTHIDRFVNAKEALTSPIIPDNAFNNEFTRQSVLVIERLKYIKPGKNAWSEDIPQHLRLNVKGAKLSNIYRRLHPNEPAYTVTGSGGGGTHMYHWEENRALTNRERARLQTFPDSYIFEGNKEAVRKQIGMAVPPLGMSIIFKALLNSFAKNDYPFVKPNM